MHDTGGVGDLRIDAPPAPAGTSQGYTLVSATPEHRHSSVISGTTRFDYDIDCVIANAENAAGGSGMIWFEACAVAGEGRANPYQIWLKDDTADAFKRMVDQTRAAAWDPTVSLPSTVVHTVAAP